MTRAVLAEFTQAQAFETALSRARAAGFEVVETLTPYPPPKDEADEASTRELIRNSLVVGAVVAAILYLVEYLSSVVAYPIDSGGRPHDSWPAFIPAVFEIGVLAGSVTGFVEFLRRARLPQLADPVFEAPGVERASQDRFFAALAPVDGASEFAMRAGALRTSEVEL